MCATHPFARAHADAHADAHTHARSIAHMHVRAASSLPHAPRCRRAGPPPCNQTRASRGGPGRVGGRATGKGAAGALRQPPRSRHTPLPPLAKLVLFLAGQGQHRLRGVDTQICGLRARTRGRRAACEKNRTSGAEAGGVHVRGAQHTRTRSAQTRTAVTAPSSHVCDVARAAIGQRALPTSFVPGPKKNPQGRDSILVREPHRRAISGAAEGGRCSRGSERLRACEAACPRAAQSGAGIAEQLRACSRRSRTARPLCLL